LTTIALVYSPYRFRPPIWPESRPPLVIAHLSALLNREKLGNVEAIDLDLEFNNSEEKIDCLLRKAMKRIERIRPTVLCLTCKTAQFPFAALLSRMYKMLHPETRIIMGGWMPTLDPELALKLSKCDAVVRGEAERSLPELLRRITEGKWEIDGVSYRASGSNAFIHNPNSRPLTQEELDSLPLPSYKSLPPLRKYFPVEAGERPCFTIEASRGCTHGKCIFSWNSTNNCNTSWRAYSPRRVVREMAWLNENYESKIFFFADDNFGAMKTWLNEFVSRMSVEFRQGEVGYVASMRIDSIDETMIQALHRSGLRAVFHGVESGSKEIWRTIGKGFNREINHPYILDLARKEIEAGVVPIFSFVAGIPNETEKDLDETITLCQQLVDLGAMTSTQILTPHQGTALYQLYSDRIEPYDTYHELGRSENFQKEFHDVFGDRLKEFRDLPDFKRVRPSMPLNSFIERYSMLPGGIVKP
jgi:anaerobic magnesium-protoporphyrin IX monomethyl ester cyclase